MIDLDPIKARADAATEGPWEALGRIVEQSDWSVGYDEIVSCEVDCGSYCQGGTGKGVINEADAEFIAAARQDIPALIAEVERLQGIVERVRELHPYEVIELHESHGEEAWCPECQFHYPCRTICALEES